MRGSWMLMAAWHFDPPAGRYPSEGSARLALPPQSFLHPAMTETLEQEN